MHYWFVFIFLILHIGGIFFFPELILFAFKRNKVIFNFLTGLYCCDRAEDYVCQTACKRILMSMKTELEIVDGLIEGCKTMPLPQDPLWQCFLESSRSVHPGVTVHPPPSTGLDGAKLHCCSKANSSTCRSVSLYSHLQLWKWFRSCLISGLCLNPAMYIK